MKKLLIIGILILILFINGCVQNAEINEEYDNIKKEDNLKEENSQEIKTISINGIDKEQEVSSDIPVKLLVNGMRNTIRVKENTIINELSVNGMDITIYLPESSNPIIKDNGIRTKIIYY